MIVQIECYENKIVLEMKRVPAKDTDILLPEGYSKKLVTMEDGTSLEVRVKNMFKVVRVIYDVAQDKYSLTVAPSAY